ASLNKTEDTKSVGHGKKQRLSWEATLAYGLVD
ncbi:unnamed protein product, partial [Onchocerca ochengi]|uniref:Transposase n=1 Tax=Onchocerca ochengi TaxID=42157 RepID=A0A182F0K0_ONCOC